MFALAFALGMVRGAPDPSPPPVPDLPLALVEGVVRTSPTRPVPTSLPAFLPTSPTGSPSTSPPGSPRTPPPTGPGSPDAAVGEPVEAATSRFEVALPSGVVVRVLLDLPPEAPPPDLLPGDGVAVLGRLRPRLPSRNPGAYDPADPAGPPPEGDLQVPGPDAVHRVPQALGVGDALRRVGETVRAAALHRLRDACGGGPGYGLLACTLTGDRTDLPREIARVFRDSGTAHVLAVSGLHLVLLTGSLAALARRTVPEPLRRRCGLAATVLVVVAFSAACRFETPVLRAAAFVVTGAVARALHRRPSPWDQLWTSAAIVTGVAPDQLYDPGFRLSFVAVLGLLLFTERVRDALFPDLRILRRFPGALSRRRMQALEWFASAIPTTVAAQAATSPVVASVFGTVQPAGLLANLFAVPAFALLLPAGCVLALLGSPAAPVGEPASDLAAEALEGSLGAVCSIPGATLRFGRPPPLAVAVAVLCLVAAARASPFRRRDLLWFLASTLALVLPQALRATRAEVIVLDVGHGVCVVVRAADGTTVLCDAGGRAPGLGDRVVLPALRELGVRRLDAVFLSHEDADHGNALPEVLDGIPVASVVVPRGFGRSALARSLLADCAMRGVPVVAAVRGDRWAVGALSVDVVGPADATRRGAENEDSLLLRIAVRDGDDRVLSVFATGDVEGGTLDALTSVPPCGPSDVFLLPHHGRAPPAAQRRLAWLLGVRCAVASSADPAARLPTVAGRTWSTADTGALRIRRGRDDALLVETWPWNVAGTAESDGDGTEAETGAPP